MGGSECATITVIAGRSLDEAARETVRRLELSAAAVSLVVHDVSEPSKALSRALRASGATVRERVPDSGIRSIRSAFSTGWETFAVGARASRLREVRLAPGLIPPSQVIAVIDRTTGGVRGQSLLDLWPRFAHPALRAGSAVGDDRTGITAEIALAVSPIAVLIAGRCNDLALFLVTQDQIVAELIAESMDPIPDGTDLPDRVGPWEQPLVQRATELELGVLTPSAISVNMYPLNALPTAEQARCRDFVRRVVERFGVGLD